MSEREGHPQGRPQGEEKEKALVHEGRAEPLDYEFLERFRAEVETCFGTSCNMCERDCPVYQVVKQKPYASRGKNRTILSLLLGQSELSERMAEVVFACTLCGSCDAHCAYLNTERFEALRAELVKAGYEIPAHHALVERVRQTGSAYGEEMARPRPGEVTLFAGCAFGVRENRLKKIVRALEGLGLKARIEEEVCCGYPLRAFGYRKDFREHSQRFRQTFVEKLQPGEEVVTLCPTCHLTLRGEYKVEATPALAWTIERLESLEKEGTLAPKTARLREKFPRVTYHDPCHLARYASFVEGPRQVLSLLGLEVVEMEHHGVWTACCGGGGGLVGAHAEIHEEVGLRRMKEAQQTKAPVLVTDCPTCEVTLKNASATAKAGIKVRSIWDLLAELR